MHVIHLALAMLQDGARAIDDMYMYCERVTYISVRECCLCSPGVQLVMVTQQCGLRERELQQRLQVRENSHNKSLEELRGMLTSQFQVATRYIYTSV